MIMARLFGKFLTKNHLLLLLIIFIAAILRLIWLDRVPNSVNFDEIYYLLNSKAFFLTGKDFSQTIPVTDILLFRSPPNELPQSELPFFLQMTTSGWRSFSLVENALPNAFLSLLTVIILYLIAKKLFDEQIALITGFVAAINPWSIFIGRTSYEVVPAVFFFLLGFYLLLILKGWKILFSFPVFVLAFYSYIGTKLIFAPLVLVFTAFCYFQNRKYLKQYIAVLVLSVILVLFYFFQISNAPQGVRLKDIVTPNNSAIVDQVNYIRKTSIHNFFSFLLENKFTVFGKVVVTNFLHVFSFDYLFLQGDYFFSLGRHGLFYLIDILFLTVGVVWLFLAKRKIFLLFSILVLISTVPQILHDPKGEGNFTPHIAFIFPFFIMLIAVGIYQTLKAVGPKSYYLVLTVILFLYVLSVGNFLNIYFYQFPLQNGIFDFPNRVLSRYLSLSESDQRIFVYSKNPKDSFEKYIFYTNGYSKQNAVKIAENLRIGKFSNKNVDFLPCSNDKDLKIKSGVVIIDVLCGNTFSAKHISIPQLTDSGAVYSIFNDRTCSGVLHNRYISNLSVSDFAVEKLSKESFCKTFITSL